MDDLKGRSVFSALLATVVHAGVGYICMPNPKLHLFQKRIIFGSVGDGGRAPARADQTRPRQVPARTTRYVFIVMMKIYHDFTVKSYIFQTLTLN